MSSINKVFLIGRLGGDPEVSFLKNGDPVANFSLATSTVTKSPTGERVDQTEWHRIVCFGKTADVCAQFVKKGNRLHVEGRIRYRKWTDKEGAEKISAEIVASSVTLLESKTAS